MLLLPRQQSLVRGEHVIQAGQSESFFGIYYTSRGRAYFFHLISFTLKDLKSPKLLETVLLLCGKGRPKGEATWRRQGELRDGHAQVSSGPRSQRCLKSISQTCQLQQACGLCLPPP